MLGFTRLSSKYWVIFSNSKPESLLRKKKLDFFFFMVILHEKLTKCQLEKHESSCRLCTCHLSQ